MWNRLGILGAAQAFTMIKIVLMQMKTIYPSVGNKKNKG